MMHTATIPGIARPVATISLGTAAFGSVVNTADSFRLLDAYLTAGGNLIDTAHVYADWHGGERSLSEKTIGVWLRASGMRDQVVIATKGGHPDMATQLIPRLAPEQIISDIDGSLACLGVEQIDLYYLHRDDPQRPVGEIMETLHSQVQVGKINQIGCSNWQPARIQAAQEYASAHSLTRFAASQIFWSLATANPGTFASDHALMDAKALAFYQQAGLVLSCFTSQARGFFTKAASFGIDSLKPDRRQAFENPTNLERLIRAQVLARELGVSVSAVVLAFITSHGFVGIPVVGPLSLEQLHDSLSGADLQLTPEQIAYLIADQQTVEAHA